MTSLKTFHEYFSSEINTIINNAWTNLLRRSNKDGKIPVDVSIFFLLKKDFSSLKDLEKYFKRKKVKGVTIDNLIWVDEEALYEFLLSSGSTATKMYLCKLPVMIREYDKYLSEFKSIILKV